MDDGFKITSDLPCDHEIYGWTEEAIDVETFLKTYELPQVVKVDGGDYGNTGFGTHCDISRPFLLYKRLRCAKVLASSVYWDDSKQNYAEIGQKLIIPLDFKGWFWFLQDCGQVGGKMYGLEEVIKAKAIGIVIRAPIKCLKSQRNPESSETFYGEEQMNGGEALLVGDVITETIDRTSKCCLSFLNCKGMKKVQYVMCKDGNDNQILLNFVDGGEFSLIGEPGVITEDALYQLDDIIHHHKLPLHLKLAHGNTPSIPCSFTGMLKVEQVYEEDTVIACSVGHENHTMVEFPLDSDIRFMCATNIDNMMKLEAVNKTSIYLKQNADSYTRNMKVIQNLPSSDDDFNHSKSNLSAPVRELPPLPNAAYECDSESGSIVTETDLCTDSDCYNDHCSDKIPPNYDTQSDINEPRYEMITKQNIKQLEQELEDKLNVSNGYLNPRHTFIEPQNDVNNQFKNIDTDVESKVNSTTDSQEPFSTHQDSDMYQISNVARHICEMAKQWNDDGSLVDNENCISSNPIDVTPKPRRTVSLDNNYDVPPKQSDFKTREEFRDFLENLFNEACTDEVDNFHRCVDPPAPWKDDYMHYKSSVSPCHNATNPMATIRSHNVKRRADYERAPSRRSLHMADVFRQSLRYSSLTKEHIMMHKYNSANQISNDDFSMENYDVPRSHYVSPQNHNHYTFNSLRKNYTASWKNGNDHANIVRSASFNKERTDNCDSGIYLQHNSMNGSELSGYDGDSVYMSSTDVAWTPPEDLSELSVLEVAKCLRYIGLKSNMITRFVEEQIDGKQLFEMNANLLLEGFPELNALERKKVMDFAAGWRPKKL